jgi:hypothetical protein
MAEMTELLVEAKRRGILPPEAEDLYAEAQKRGLVPAESMTLGESLSTAVGNIPSSAVQFGKDITTPIHSPVQFAKGTYGLLQGVADSVDPMRPLAEAAGIEQADNSAPVTQMIEFYKDRYGGWDKFKQTLAQDPVGVLADFATVLMGSGAALKPVATATKSGTVAKIGQALTATGTAIDPVNIATQATIRPVSAAVKNVPKRMYESALKLSTVLDDATRNRMIETGLEAGLVPSKRGLDKARQMISDLNTTIDRVIDQLATDGKTVDTYELFRNIDDVRREAYLSDDPIKNIRAIDQVETSIQWGLEQAGKKDKLSARDVQDLKKRIYKAVTYEHRERGPLYRDTTKKVIARAAKEELEFLYPELKALNAKDGALIELYSSLEQAANRISNRDLMGLNVTTKATVGAVYAQAANIPAGVGMGSGIALGLIDTPKIKSRLAIALERARIKGAPNQVNTLTRQGAYQAGRLVNEGLE